MPYETFNPADSDFNNRKKANPVRVLKTDKPNSEVSADEVKDLTPPYYYPTLISKENRADGLATHPKSEFFSNNPPLCTITTASLPGREAVIKDWRKSQNIGALLGFLVCLIPFIAIALFIFIPWHYALSITLLSTAVVAYFIFTVK
jgi:hypothetical protein